LEGLLERVEAPPFQEAQQGFDAIGLIGREPAPTGIIASLRVGHPDLVFNGLKPDSVIGKPVETEDPQEFFQLGHFHPVENGRETLPQFNIQKSCDSVPLDPKAGIPCLSLYLIGNLRSELMLHLSEPIPIMDKGSTERIHNPFNQEFSFLLVLNLHFLVSWHSGKVAEELRIPLLPQGQT
jgi:hypothetical protein